MAEKYNFGEKVTEWSAKQRKELKVYVSPKFTQSRTKAIEIIKKYQNINTGDFWILMNETKNDEMAYNGLIISHNACLKINDEMPQKDKFKPSCVTLDKNGYKDSLVYTYCNDEQCIYEVGEVTDKNCKNAYPYAMAYKRLFDRVVLKLCKLAFDGVYSDSEADEFAERQNAAESEQEATHKPLTRAELEDKIVALCDAKRLRISDVCKQAKVTELAELDEEKLQKVIEWINDK